MKKICWILALSLLLTGCGQKESSAVPAPEASAQTVEEQEPLTLESLTVEFLRGGADAATLMQVVKELPEQFKAALEEYGVEVEEVSVTMSGSSAATAQAVEEGGADLAFLPVEELVRADAYPRVLALAGEYRTDLYAADTEYGANLSKRSEPTWAELDHARWGVVAGEDAIELWLTDHYEGNGLSDLSAVTEYGTWEDLYAAAEAGEIDLFPAVEEMTGFTLLSKGEPFYKMAVVVSEEKADGRLTEALLSTLEDLQKGEFTALFGPEPYTAGTDGDLDGQRRLATITG